MTTDSLNPDDVEIAARAIREHRACDAVGDPTECVGRPDRASAVIYARDAVAALAAAGRLADHARAE